MSRSNRNSSARPSKVVERASPVASSPALRDTAPATSTGGGDHPSIKWSQERRLQFIDFRLQWERRINRRDLMEFFKISVPQASADISIYSQLAPKNLTYDTSSRTYLAPPGFTPIYDTTGPRQYLSQLLALDRQVLPEEHSFIAHRPGVASVPLPTRTIDRDTLVLVLQAIGTRARLQVRYQSIARDEEQRRFISPHGFGYDGTRWHVRAYCHMRDGFRDFVVGRILEAGPLAASAVDPAEDFDWHTSVELVLAPDPSLSERQRRGVEIDYGMKAGKVSLMCRRAMLFYTLRSLNFESNGKPRKGERQLVIVNLDDIRELLPKPGQA
jgi:predicted DNA-binding transcriptional regulator YafY